MKRTRVFIVDDHKIFRQGLASLLDSIGQFEVVGDAPNGREAIRPIQECTPDVVFLDISMPELDGLNAMKHIHRACANTKIIVLTMHDKSEYVYRALCNGACGYLLKEAGVGEIQEAVSAVMQGQTYLSKSVNQIVIRDYANGGNGHDRKSVLEVLTEREMEVMKLVVEGYSGKEVAQHLNISPKTVEHHRAKVMEKLSCRNVTQLVRLAIQEGVI